MQTQNIIPEYQTLDITLAAALKGYGYQLDRIDINGKRGVFVFKDVEKEVLKSYDCGEVRVEPASFHNDIKLLTTAVKRHVNG